MFYQIPIIKNTKGYLNDEMGLREYIETRNNKFSGKCKPFYGFPVFRRGCCTKGILHRILLFRIVVFKLSRKLVTIVQKGE